jgi:hypothetical protein
MQDIKNDYDEENLSYLGLNLKRAQKVTWLGVITTWLKLKARVWCLGFMARWILNLVIFIIKAIYPKRE